MTLTPGTAIGDAPVLSSRRSLFQVGTDKIVYARLFHTRSSSTTPTPAIPAVDVAQTLLSVLLYRLSTLHPAERKAQMGTLSVRAGA
jgi:hypothetical protein